MHGARHEADALEGEQLTIREELLTARLGRYLPHLTDVITWAIDEDCTWCDDRGPPRDDDNLMHRA